MALDLNKVVCIECGVKYLTEAQKKERVTVSMYKDRCCECKEVKLVTSIKNYNYLKKPTE